MSVLSSLIGRRPSRERPDLVEWLGGASPVLVIDGGTGDTIPGATVLRHETSGGPGVPFHYPDKRRLPAADAEFRAVVLAGVMTKVIDAGAALEEARRVVVPGGSVLVIDTVAPDDFEERAIWNALAKMLDARHASALSSRQLGALMSSSGMPVEREAGWDATGARAELSGPAALLVAAARSRGAGGVVREGAIVEERRAYLLRRT